MPRVDLFCEDSAQEKIVGGLVERMADEQNVSVQVNISSATGGYGRVVEEFRQFVKDLHKSAPGLPDLVIVATDVNCQGRADRLKELQPSGVSRFPVVFALPDPHVERWLLLDGAAFREVVGKGCNAPDHKCERDRYKQFLHDAVRQAGIEPILGGLEFAEDIVRKMNLPRAGRHDAALRQFMEEFGRYLNEWRR